METKINQQLMTQTVAPRVSVRHGGGSGGADTVAFINHLEKQQ